MFFKKEMESSKNENLPLQLDIQVLLDLIRYAKSNSFEFELPKHPPISIRNNE